MRIQLPLIRRILGRSSDKALLRPQECIVIPKRKHSCVFQLTSLAVVRVPSSTPGLSLTIHSLWSFLQNRFKFGRSTRSLLHPRPKFGRSSRSPLDSEFKFGHSLWILLHFLLILAIALNPRVLFIFFITSQLVSCLSVIRPSPNNDDFCSHSTPYAFYIYWDSY